LSGTLAFRDALRPNVGSPAFIWGVTGTCFYAVVVMVYAAVRFRTMYAAERLNALELATRSAALEAELTRSKLDTLRSQLRPHFLFNTLNAISVFVMEDADKARDMVLRLSTLLRRSLDEEAHEVPLKNELAFVRLPRNPARPLRRSTDGAARRGSGGSGRTRPGILVAAAPSRTRLSMAAATTTAPRSSSPRAGTTITCV
jgi:hypothetical protein